jgi:hypothetical protein
MKKWLPFGITFITAAGVAAGLYIWKSREIEDLSRSQPSGISRSLTRAPAGKITVKAGKTEQAKLDAGARPTPNGLRTLFERASRIMEMDREEVEKLITELEETGRIRSPIMGVNLMAAFARLAELDPAAAMARAAKGKGEMRDIGMFAAMNEWISRDRQGAIAWFAASKDDESKRKFLTVATIAMGGNDPDLIASLSAGIQDPDSRRKAMMEAIGALAVSNPDAALKKLNEIEDPDEREKAGEQVYQGFLFRYPDKALAFAISQPPGTKARDNIRQSLVQWGEQDAGAALKWMTSQNKEVQKELFDTQDKGPGWGFGKATPEQINEAALQLGDQSQRDKLRAAYANSQAWNDPKTGLEQLHTIKDLDLQKATAGAIGTTAARSGKTNEMKLWLETAPPNDTRDLAVASFASGLAQRDPSAGMEWAAKITNAAIRNQTVEAMKALKPPK